MKLSKELLLLVLVLSILSILWSCTGKDVYQAPKFPKTESRSFELLSGDLILGITKSMQVYNGEIIVCSTAPDGNWLHIYDRTNGEMKASAIPQGRGPGEGLNLHSSYLDMSTETLCYYDFNMHKLLSIDLKQTESGGAYVTSELDPCLPMNRANALIPVPQGGFLLCNYFISFEKQNKEGLNRYMYFDAAKSLKAEYVEWPELEENALLSLYAYPETAFDSDGMHWVVGTQYGAILESFSLKNGEIVRDWIRYFYPTDMGAHMNDAGNSESVLGFSKICVKEGIIYSVVDFDHSLKQIISKEFKQNPETLNSKIAVFSQEGKPIRLIETGVRVNEIAVDDGCLFAVIETSDGKECLAKMQL
ncbi:MAG: hypothetical protein IJQ96_08270 [Bacteroidales bacterium]|nr:hypothetical protein [Bacteroidales bacterium]